ncbi:MAG: M56 family metallopeptidase, partial [Planctomycetota bacterium]
MNPIIENIADLWAARMWPAIWQSTILAAVIYFATLSLRKKAAAIRFWLWMLIPLRLIVMPLITIGVPVLPPSTDSAIFNSGPSSTWRISTNYVSPESTTPIKSSPNVKIENRVPAITTADSHLSIRTVLMIGWLIGVTISLVRLITGWRRMRRIVTGAIEVKDDSLAAASLRLRHVPRILVTEKEISPFVFGIIRPCIVLPKVLMNKDQAEALSAVLAHESAHLHRRDLLTGWILAICELIYFFHPILYFVKRNILIEREKACDEYVLAVDRSKRGIYANALIDAAQICRSLKNRLTPLSVIAESFTDLKKRLIAIGTNNNPKADLSTKTLILLILISIICLPGVAIKARETAPERQSPDSYLEPTDESAHSHLNEPPLAKLVTRIYDVAILYAGLVARPLGPDKTIVSGVIDHNCQGGPNAEAAAIKRLGEPVNTIKETIEPNSWSDAGGPGTIEVHEYRKFIILQTPEIHQKIEILLNEMKKAKSRAIQIEARFIEVSEDFLNYIRADVNSMLKMSTEIGKVEFIRKHFELGIADANVSTSSKGYTAIQNDFSTLLLLRAIQNHKDSKMLVAPKVTVLNGEYASLSVLTDTLYVSGLIEPNTTLTQFEQQVDSVNTGTTIQVLPKITSQGDILLELDLSLNSV